MVLASVCVFYFGVVVGVLLQDRASNFSTQGVTTFLPGPRVVSGQVIHYTFPSSVRHIDDLVLFAESKSYRANKGARLSIALEGANTTTRDIVIGDDSADHRIRHGNILGIIFKDVHVTKQPELNIMLTISAPEGLEDPGIRLLATKRFTQKDRLIVGASMVTDWHLMVQIHYLDHSKLKKLIAAGCILLSIVFIATLRHRLHYGFSFVVIMALALVLSEFSWHQKLDEFYGWFWPDGYVQYARVLRLWFTGELSWTGLLDYTGGFRNAHAWMVPASIAALSLSGLSYVLSYSLLNMAAYAGLVGAWTLLFARRFAGVRQFDVMLFMVAVASHYLHLRVGTSLLTDILACYFVALFFLLFCPMIDNAKNARASVGLRAILWSTLALFLALQTRLAMIPLIIAPLILVLWMLVRDRFFNKTIEPYRLASASSVSAGAIILSLGVYAVFGLYHSIALAKEMVGSFSTNNFVFTRFLVNLNILLVPAYFALLVGRSAALKSNIYSLIWIFIMGYLCLLYFGQVPTWPRYLAPLAAPVVFFTLSIMMQRGDAERPLLYRASAVLMIAYQIYHFFASSGEFGVDVA